MRAVPVLQRQGRQSRLRGLRVLADMDPQIGQRHVPAAVLASLRGHAGDQRQALRGGMGVGRAGIDARRLRAPLGWDINAGDQTHSGVR